ncbi:TonB-dependent receptor [Gilliamella sp. wkB112]|uniref:TonB-dependent receptor n=1 Tax=Gilliamella sp. wkB112 TaxID=3120257 RepID=UPI00080E8F23|nr:TonB-dependent receptor [Gilliamella apicola]OCG03066.1 hypothetical protein A9G12_09120 [Gilliamella apicola]
MKNLKTKLSILSLCVISSYSVSSAANEPSNKVKTEPSDDVIIVVGEKFDRSEVATGSSVNIITKKELERRPDLNTLTQIFKEIPNVIDTGLGNELPTIRGIEGSNSPGTMTFLTGARPRFNILVDGSSSNYNEVAFGAKSLWDMKQIEIYRGPQSYAQGRNAIAGAVIMQSNDPVNEYESAFKLDYGNQHRRQYATMLSGPVINDELLFRLSVDRQERQSYEHLAHYHPAGNSGRFEANTVRAKLNWLPSSLPDFYSRFTFSHTDANTPQGEFKPRNLNETYRAVFQVRSSNNIWDVGYQINDFMEIANKLVYANYVQDRYALRSGGPARLEGHQIQVEPTIKFNTDNYRGLLGLFYFTSPQDESVFLMQRNTYRDKTKTKAVYGEITFNPLEVIEVNLSARYEQEKHTRNGGKLFAVNYKSDDKEFLPKLDIAYLFDQAQRIGFKIARGYNPGGAGISFIPPFTTYKYDTEYVWNYELYHRWISPDNRLKLTTNLFYNDYKNLQLPYVNIYGSPVIDNANKAVTYGAEFNINWQAIEDLNLIAGAGVLKTKIKEYKKNPNYNNNKLSRSPALTLNLGTNYQLPSGFEIGANLNYTGSYYSSISNSKNSKSNGYSQANAYLAYNFKHGSVKLYTENVFDSDKKIKIIDGGYTTYQQPRLVGLSTELKF